MPAAALAGDGSLPRGARCGGRLEVLGSLALGSWGPQRDVALWCCLRPPKKKSQPSLAKDCLVTWRQFLFQLEVFEAGSS